MSLMSAYHATFSEMKPQIQGTCGIYSFWYATILLRYLAPTKYPEVPLPRACHALGPKTKGTSMRAYAKHTIGSAQGELLNVGEMVSLVTHFGYQATVYSRWNYIFGGREAFISEHLKANRPVLFAYICGNGPVTKATATGKAQVAYGSHWSLLIAEQADDYCYINPHKDNVTKAATLLKYPKATVLDSIDNVDDVKYDADWVKRASHDLLRAADLPTGTPIVRTYDLGDPSRQSLNNVLIAVG